MADKDITGWITAQGRRVPIRKGQSKKEAISKNIRKGEGKYKNQMAHSKYGRAYTDHLNKEDAEASAKKEKKDGWNTYRTEKIGVRGARKKKRRAK